MQFLYLALAILFEVVGSAFLKVSDGFSKLIPTLITISAYIISFYFFSQTLKSLPLGVAYAIWGGMGIVFTALISVFVFKQPIDWAAIIGITLIIAGVIILNVFSKALR